MRIVHLSLLTVALFGTLASAQWVVSPNCQRRRTFDPNEPVMSAVMKRSESVSPDKSLRGSAASADRQLQLTTIMLKMHWEEGYCWQEEWGERKWCLRCEGIRCNEDDYLSIDECDVNEDNQWFVYESINAANNEIKLKPMANPDLCWTRTGGTDHQLKPCGSDYLDDFGLDRQIIIGFQETGSFELHPKGRSGECLVNDSHHPKWGEIIRAFDCDVAQNDRTSLWEVYTSEQVNGADLNDDNTDDDDDADNIDLPAIENKGLEFCTPDSPCGLCIGDCNNDDECEGDLICYNRKHYEDVPFCSGGSNDGSIRDYCTYPY